MIRLKNTCKTRKYPATINYRSKEPAAKRKRKRKTTCRRTYSRNQGRKA